MYVDLLRRRREFSFLPDWPTWALTRAKCSSFRNVVKSPSDLQPLVKLAGAPQAFTETSDGSILVATTRGISRISSSGSTEDLLHRYLGMLYPNSIAAAPDDAIYVGMRFFVVRLTPHAGEYIDQLDGSRKL